MKKSFLLAIIFCLSFVDAKSQTIVLDSVSNITYAEINPVQWVRNENPATRLYVWSSNYIIGNSITLVYQIRAVIDINASTKNTIVLSYGQYNLIGQDFILWDKSDSYLFNKIADLPEVDVVFKN